MRAWPPQLDDLRAELELTEGDERPGDAQRLQAVLDAAVAYVARVRGSSVNLTGAPGSGLPGPDGDLLLGTLRLAARWHTRRRSPEGLLAMGELGAARVPSVDPDIERLLRIGRFARSVIA